MSGGKGKRLLKAIILLLSAAFIFSIAVYFFYPNISKLKKENPKKSSFMDYREKQWKEEKNHDPPILGPPLTDI